MKVSQEEMRFRRPLEAVDSLTGKGSRTNHKLGYVWWEHRFKPQRKGLQKWLKTTGLQCSNGNTLPRQLCWVEQMALRKLQLDDNNAEQKEWWCACTLLKTSSLKERALQPNAWKLEQWSHRRHCPSSSLQNNVFCNINEMVFLDKDSGMDTVQKHNICAV